MNIDTKNDLRESVAEAFIGMVQGLKAGGKGRALSKFGDEGNLNAF